MCVGGCTHEVYGGGAQHSTTAPSHAPAQVDGSGVEVGSARRAVWPARNLPHSTAPLFLPASAPFNGHTLPTCLCNSQLPHSSYLPLPLPCHVLPLPLPLPQPPFFPPPSAHPPVHISLHHTVPPSPLQELEHHPPVHISLRHTVPPSPLHELEHRVEVVSHTGV